ncbi:unnamed protein product [[Actinomadura] parvosata subsp. kistnae]|uniref:Uncharacterized protein n=1 Tax=[Actinomadura] parvosata subsp. kistnae TaxID=1909395 RepID=A0A1V0AEA9_9ACTN|nr:DUF6086 family protein [Nonomuraea sp. ATCC 55076]AQZ68538.1 hypothetical protein BKM31_50020 [Nonomuraea sp. ATCC 55076]SPL92999.1 unnamed protein product [Actinomadura parvosata subsp. kistnae]
MSQYYQVGEHVLWNPSNGVSALFLRTAQALAPETGLPTGLGPMENDECQVDLPVFTAFVGALVDRYERSNHPILHALMEGFIATALVLVQRAEAELIRSGGRRDVRVSRPFGGGAGRWAELTARHARAMPR